MTTTETILFELLRAGLDTRRDSETFDRSLRPDWTEVYRLASAQGVLAVAWDGLQRLAAAGEIPAEAAPDRALNVQWAYNVQVIEERYARQKKALSRMTKFFAAADIRIFLMKGYGLSLCYPVPEHRPCGDIDVWMFGEQKRADDLLRAKGVKVELDKHHHTIFHVDGTMVENHYEFINIHSHLSSIRVERELQLLARQPAEVIDVDGAGVCLPSPDFSALFLLRHAAGHFASVEIGLRHVVDWGMFVRRYGERVDWQRLEAFVRKENMHRFLHSMNAACIDFLGVDAALFPDFERDDALELRVLNDILHPEFSEPKPDGFARIIWYKCRRWWANRWKHRITYTDGLLSTFLVQIYCHLQKPKSLTS